MAKLGAYYGLCPLIDQKNLLGISEDVESGHIIVTLGKNIAVIYRLSDQKQIQSWRTKDKFTSPVIFDNDEDKYVGVFNQVSIRLWANEDIEQLDKIKKYKFIKPIHTLITCNKKTFVIFKNGCILTLTNAIEQRKDLDIAEIINTVDEEIIDVVYASIESTIHIGLIIQSKSTKTCIWTTFMDSLPNPTYQRIKLSRNNCSLSGYTCCYMSNKSLNFLTLWSDGQLYFYPVSNSSNIEAQMKHTEECGYLYSSIESISCKQFVAMVGLANDHIALYGANCNQEGASLIIYNMQFKISQSKQTFKMFSNITKIWCIENVLLLCSGQNLAVVPFHINTEQLSELIGSHTIDISDTDIQETFAVETWDIACASDYSKLIPLKIKEHVLHYLGQGLPETLISNYLISSYIESSDVDALENCINYFKDISEHSIVQLLVYLIEQLTFNELQAPVRHNLIDKVLTLPFTENLLLPHIKKYFTIDATIKLIKYISSILSSDTSVCLPELNLVQTDNKLIQWSSVILDGSYQKILLTRDNEVCEELKKFEALIQGLVMDLHLLETLEPVLDRFVQKKSVCTIHLNNNGKYSVEDVKLY